MSISVIGTGYVGLVSGVCFAEMGNQVICVDNNPDKLEKLKNAELTIYEPGLEVLLYRNIAKKPLSFTDDLKHAVLNSSVIFLCLPTPQGEDGSVSIGESIIYSDRFEPIYLFPLMFFRAADHYLSRQNNSAGGNSQFFISISSRNHIPNTHLYASGIIDEISYGSTKASKNQSGFTLGGSVADPGVKNLKLTIEYIRILPFVYMHYIPTQRYQNASYNMGHWMGSNADLIYAAVQYRILRGLTTNFWFQAIRKGDEGDPEMQHTIPQAPFLFGSRKNYTYIGAEIKYELTHELFLRGRYIHHKNEFQQPDKTFINKNFSEFYMAIYYGL